MTLHSSDTDVVSVNVVAWPAAILHLDRLAARDYRLAAKAATEFDRGRLAGRAEMAEELKNLPEALAVLAQEDARESRRSGKPE